MSTMTSPEKDAWILSALAERVITVDPETGAVHRRVPHKEGPYTFYKREPVVLRTHKKSGRVVFDLRHLGLTKTVLLNRVVSLACHPNPLGLPESNHRDGNKQNNRPDNLEWADRSSQELHAQKNGLKTGRGSSNANAKLTAAQVMDIRCSSLPPAELAAAIGVSVKTIKDVISRKAWAHL